MALLKLNKNQRMALIIFTAVAVFFGLWFLRGYLMLIIFAGIMATLFYPVYEWFKRKGRSKSTSSLLTFFVSMFVIIIPVTLVGVITFYQIEGLVSDIANNTTEIDLNDAAQDVVDYTNDILADVGVEYRLSVEELTQRVGSAAAAFGSAVFNSVVGAFSGFFGLITAALIYVYVFMSMLTNKETILATIKRLNPLGEEVALIYLSRVQAMTKATVRGQFIIAFMQGLASAAVIAFVGPSNLFFFLLMLLTIMSIIPLGAGIITIPLGIIMALTGNVAGGIIVVLNHLLIVTNIDNVMRPILVPKNARLDPALMILAVFSGLALFGFLGIVIGPVIMILIVTTLQVYNEVFYKEESIDRTKHKKKPGYYSRLKKKWSKD